MKTIFKIILVMIALMHVTNAQVPLLNRVGTTIYPWRPGDKFSDSLLSSNAALLNKNNIFTGAVNTFNAINSSAITATGKSVFDSIKVNGISYLNSVILTTSLDTAYSNSVANISVTSPLSVASSGKTRFLSLSNLGSMYYVDSTKYHGSASINTIGALTSGSIAPGFGSINIGTNTIIAGAITSTGQISGATLRASSENIYIGSVTNVYRIDNLGSAGYEWRFLNSGNSINGITANGINQSGSAANSFSGATTVTSGGVNLTLRKTVGAALQFDKTDAPAQSWQFSGEETAFKLYDVTASNATLLSIAKVTGDATFSRQIIGKIGVFGTGMNVALKPLAANKFDGTEIFSVDTIGNVALSLNSKLYLSGFANDYFLQFSSGKMTLSGGNQTIDGVDIKGSGFIDLYTRSIARVRIDSSGNVGIGASSPPLTAKLAVKAGLTANTQEWYRSASNTAVASIDTNGSMVLSPDGANIQPIITLKGRGGSNEQYSAWITTANAKVRVNPSFEVLDGSANPNTGASVFLVNNLGLVSIGIPTISNTARFQVKSLVTHPKVQEWYRSGSTTAVASVDTNGSVTFNNKVDNVSRFSWDATANGGAGVLSLSYISTDRVFQKGTDLQVGSLITNGSTYIVSGISSSASIQLGSSGSPFTSTSYVGVKANNSRPNIQEWHRSASSTAVASIDTTGIGQFNGLKIGGSGFVKIDSAKVLGDTLKYYINGVAYNAVKGSRFNTLEALLLLGAWSSFIATLKGIKRIKQKIFTCDTYQEEEAEKDFLVLSRDDRNKATIIMRK